MKLVTFGKIGGLLSPLLCANVKNVVATDERVAVLVLQLSVDVLLGLLERNIHVTIKANQNSFYFTLSF